MLKPFVRGRFQVEIIAPLLQKRTEEPLNIARTVLLHTLHFQQKAGKSLSAAALSHFAWCILAQRIKAKRLSHTSCKHQSVTLHSATDQRLRQEIKRQEQHDLPPLG
jgi:hypothetical protein